MFDGFLKDERDCDVQMPNANWLVKALDAHTRSKYWFFVDMRVSEDRMKQFLVIFRRLLKKISLLECSWNFPTYTETQAFCWGGNIKSDFLEPQTTIYK